MWSWLCDALVILSVLSGFVVILLVVRVGGKSWLLCFHSVLAFVCVIVLVCFLVPHSHCAMGWSVIVPRL